MSKTKKVRKPRLIPKSICMSSDEWKVIKATAVLRGKSVSRLLRDIFFSQSDKAA